MLMSRGVDYTAGRELAMAKGRAFPRIPFPGWITGVILPIDGGVTAGRNN
jgi:hypothetical protein